tara:strand:- start:43 stop:258 length:216 start_codon:yes stop_codon:yes gene_type:complete
VYNMEQIKVEGHYGYVRDKIGAILNVNKEEIKAAQKRKAERKKQEKEINELKNEVGDIKKMLTQIVEKLNG